MTSIFVTGTDTGIGKTVVTSLLVRFLNDHGKKFIPYKPIQSGAEYHDGEWGAPDPYVYSIINKLDALKDQCTYLLKKACSPHLATKYENVQIDFSLIERNIQLLANQADGTIVEGAGGLFVPLTTDGYCVIDWLEKLRIPTVLVTHAGVGSINHTVLSVEALQSRGIPIAGIIMNHLQEDDKEVTHDNKQMIERLTGIPIICEVPFIAGMTEESMENVNACFQDWKIEIILEAFKNGFTTINGTK